MPYIIDDKTIGKVLSYINGSSTGKYTVMEILELIDELRSLKKLRSIDPEIVVEKQ